MQMTLKTFISGIKQYIDLLENMLRDTEDQTAESFLSRYPCCPKCGSDYQQLVVVRARGEKDTSEVICSSCFYAAGSDDIDAAFASFVSSTGSSSLLPLPAVPEPS